MGEGPAGGQGYDQTLARARRRLEGWGQMEQGQKGVG